MIRFIVRLMLVPKVAKWAAIAVLVFVGALLAPGILSGRPWIIPVAGVALVAWVVWKIRRRRKRQVPAEGEAGVGPLEHRPKN